MSPSSPPRRVGAPRGNLNAVKHGFYSRRFKKVDLEGVEHIDVKDLVEEIALIRVFTRRLLESVDAQMDPFELAFILRAICLASATVTRVIKTQYLISSSGHSDFAEALTLAIEKVNEELRRPMPSRTVAPASPPAVDPLPPLAADAP